MAEETRSKKQPRPPSLREGVAGGEARIEILGVGVDNVTMEEAIARVKGLLRQKAEGPPPPRLRRVNVRQKAYVVTPNPEMVMLARSDPTFAEILNKADLATPDGIGLVWASRILGTPLKERVSGADLFVELCAEVARRGGKVFFLGGQEGVAAKATQELKRRYPKLRVAGTFAGDGSEKGDKETVATIKNAVGRTNQPINQSTNQPIDLLFIAYGSYGHGKQEKWIKRNLEKIPVKVAMGVGGAFDFIAGEVPRAPKFIRRLGFEWLYRLIRQPWRIRRQLVLIPFAALIFKEALLDF